MIDVSRNPDVSCVRKHALDELRERLRGLFDEYGWADYTPWEVFADTLDAFAAAHDLVEVVRCEDCDCREGNSHYCLLWSICTRDSHFCADGERRKS